MKKKLTQNIGWLIAGIFFALIGLDKMSATDKTGLFVLAGFLVTTYIIGLLKDLKNIWLFALTGLCASLAIELQAGTDRIVVLIIAVIAIIAFVITNFKRSNS